jgi:hypothetical protein
MGEEDLYISEEEVEGGDEESSNRTFILIMAGLGALFVCTVVLIAVYAFVIAPNGSKGNTAANATIIAQNATVAAVRTLEAMPTDTPVPTDTPMPTNTPEPFRTNTPVIVAPSATPGPTDTPGPAAATQPPTAASGVGAPTATRAAATKVVAGASGTGTPISNTGELADTGVGSLGLFVLAVGLVAVLFIARRLRMSQH